ncbi:hypothetical protein PENANT_c026G10054 [Penicillium antarcticum]|uniref:thioredoxin-dependent peroxiredoxin n=1 Tax=Penicillium antarcticum TaxID=416450 RepID=A0A1V6PXE7_9EURO|nr:uncharacterized protein N7508_000071 [Penicillium antarcticum]KAJ5319788.1 hypothetical protein N7508_000071 [Penicillium antarcticum]OQD81689.1 hypothetical protein PENANT_c026G10054 [Penicillium antarcticum]
MSLQSALDDMRKSSLKTANPELVKIINKTGDEFKASYDASQAIQPGARFPEFTLQDATGHAVSLSGLLANGPVFFSFYRGSWCPYCNLELRALQKVLPDFKAKRVCLVAVSPELPDQSLTTSEKNGLEFTVLSDLQNDLARKLGIVFSQPDEMRTVFNAIQVDWDARYGDGNLQIPIPANILVEKSGLVKNVWLDPYWHNRMEPSTALEWINQL